MYFNWNRDVFSDAFGTEMCWSWDVYVSFWDGIF